MKRVMYTICLMLFVSGCGTITHGPTQEIPITSNPPGAVVTTTMFEWTKTPGTLKIPRANPTVLTAKLRGYETAKQKVEVKLAPWIFGNVAGDFSPTTFFSNKVTGGYVLLAIDLSTGSVGVLSPAKVHFDLIPKEKYHAPTFEEVRQRFIDQYEARKEN